MSKERIRWIDQIKGFAIICMIVSHSIPGYDSALKNWITAFNMPMFFFLTGVLNADREYRAENLPKYLKRKSISLGIPYLFFCLVYCLFKSALLTLSGESTGLVAQKFLTDLKNIICLQGIESMWFLPVFFFATLFDSFVLKRIKSKSISFFLILFFTGLLLLTDVYCELNKWIRLIGKIVGAVIFIMCGRLLKPQLLKSKLLLILALIVVFTVTALMNGFVSMNFEFGNYPVLFFINSIALTYCLCVVFKNISEKLTGKFNQILCEFGMNSIVVLVTNNLIIEVLRLLDYKLNSSFFLRHELPGCLLFAFLILFFEYFIIKLSEGKLGIIFGRI